MRERPLVLITICYIIALCIWNRWGLHPAVVFFILAALYLIFLVWSSQKGEGQFRGGTAGIVAVVVGALTLWQMRPLRPSGDDISHHIPHTRNGRPAACVFTGYICSEPRETARGGWEVEVRATHVAHRFRNMNVTGKVLVRAPCFPCPAYGERIRVKAKLKKPRDAGNPGEYCSQRHLERRGIYCRADVEEPADVSLVGREPRFDIGGVGVEVRHWTFNLFRSTMPRPFSELAAKLMCSIVYGISASPLPKVIEEPFKEAGVMHILVASGTQVSIIVGTLLVLGRGAGIPVLVQVLILLPVVFLYTIVAGGQPAILRAAVMGTLLTVALLINRDYDTWTGLSLAALIILAINPHDLFSIGFQLSFAAVVGLLAIAPHLLPYLQWLPRWLALTASLAIGAQLMVWPLLAHYFARFSPIGFLSNLVIIPVAGVLVTTGLLTCVAGFLLHTLAAGLNHVNHLLVLWLFDLTCFFARVPFASVTVSRPGAGEVVVYYAALAVATAAISPQMRPRLRWERVAAILCVVLCVWVSIRTVSAFRRELTVTFLDVGQGESIVVHSPHGRAVLIDGGSRSLKETVAERVILPYLLTKGITRLDAVIITHPHEDHINGLPRVMRELSVGMVLDSGQESASAFAGEIQQICASRRIPIIHTRRGATLDLGAGVRIFVLMPTSTPIIGSTSDVNNNSIVVKLCYGKVSFLLVGDLESEGETRLLRRGDRLQSTILKVAHQGSAGATSERFLKAVAPEVAVISVGEGNPFGHPHPIVLHRLRKSGVKLYRTDASGAITVRTNGSNYRVETFQN